MNVKDLILEAGPADELSGQAEAEAKPKPRKPSVTWEVVLSDGCDGAIRRKTAKTSKLLVLLMSQGQFYVRDEGSGVVTPLDERVLVDFLRGSTKDMGLRPVPWRGAMYGGSRQHAKAFLEDVRSESYCSLARRGLVTWPYDEDSPACGLRVYRRSTSEDYEGYPFSVDLWAHDEAHEIALRTALEFADPGTVAQGVCRDPMRLGAASRVPLILANLHMVGALAMYDEYGRDIARDYLRELLREPLLTVPPRWALRLEDVFTFMSARGQRLDGHRVIEYVVHECVRQGYGDHLERFVRDWDDDLRMQQTVHGEVRDRYPAALASHHMLLSFRTRQLREKIDESLFVARREALSCHAAADGTYLIRPPESREDMIGEAVGQSNCLASYVRPYANGETDVYFMRDASAPDDPLVTVEVRGGCLRQAYRSSNRPVTDRQRAWLEGWAEDQGFSFSAA